MPSAVLCRQNYYDHRSEKTRIVFDAVGNQATKSLESLLQKKNEAEKLKLC